MNTTNVKAMLAKAVTLGVVAAAMVAIAPSKVQAQVTFGIHLGVPIYAAPVFARPVYREPGYGYDYGYAQLAYGYYDHDREERREA